VREDGFEHDASTYQTPADLAGDADPSRGASRVFRGGCFGDNAVGTRSAYRCWNEPWFEYPDLGFRVVRSSPCSDA
jgi:formylglycine-generating enzyme required for sulfatase activity